MEPVPRYQFNSYVISQKLLLFSSALYTPFLDIIMLLFIEMLRTFFLGSTDAASCITPVLLGRASYVRTEVLRGPMYIRLIIPIGRIMAPHRLGPPDRGDGAY